MEQTITTQTKLEETNTQEKAVGSEPKILIIGYSASGKTTASVILGENASGYYLGTSQIILDALCISRGTSTHIKEEEFGDLWRVFLRDCGNLMREHDPAFLAKACLEHASIVEGVRTREEFNTCKHLFDEILWIDREIATPNETDELIPSDADKIIDNNGTIDELRKNLLNRNV